METDFCNGPPGWFVHEGMAKWRDGNGTVYSSGFPEGMLTEFLEQHNKIESLESRVKELEKIVDQILPTCFKW